MTSREKQHQLRFCRHRPKKPRCIFLQPGRLKEDIRARFPRIAKISGTTPSTLAPKKPQGSRHHSSSPSFRTNSAPIKKMLEA